MAGKPKVGEVVPVIKWQLLLDGDCRRIQKCRGVFFLAVAERGKKTKKSSQLESAEKADREVDEKLERKKKQFPGLCIPDDHDRVQKLVEHEEEDVKVAQEAMNEVRKPFCSAKHTHSTGQRMFLGHYCDIPLRSNYNMSTLS